MKGSGTLPSGQAGSGSLELAFNGLRAQGSFLLGNWLLGRCGPACAPTRLGRGGAQAPDPEGHPGRDTAGFPSSWKGHPLSSLGTQPSWR